MKTMPALFAALLMLSAENSHALDSYRYLHVTIDTPWSIFLFLLIGIFAPFILMGVLIWRYSGRKPTPPNDTETPRPPEP
jgi:hypothetical protein